MQSLLKSTTPIEYVRKFCLQHDKSIEWSKFAKAKVPYPPNFNSISKDPASLNACFPLFLTPFFISNFTLQNFNWHHSSCGFIPCELIKYNGFQINGNKADENYI